MRIPKLRDQFLLLLKAVILIERHSQTVCKIKGQKKEVSGSEMEGTLSYGIREEILRANIMLEQM